MRRILVTGANKGIGLAIVTALLDDYDDTFVLLGSRNLERGRSAASGLVDTHPTWSERLEVVELDVSSDDSVANAAAHIAATFGATPAPLYGVVNNAGVVTADIGTLLDVNVFGVRRVCEAVVPLLDPTRGRVVNITSAAGPNYVADCDTERKRFFLDANIEWPALDAFMRQSIPSWPADNSAYGLSKACANSYTMLLARNHPALRVNACTPGFIETDSTRPWAEEQGKAPSEIGLKPPSEGTRSALFLLFGEPEGNGRYYGSDAKRSPLDRYRAPGTEPYTGD